MALVLTILKLLTVLFFLVKFIRGGRLVWGIGLLTVTTALLLDTFVGTLGGEAMRERMGFFYYVLSGALFAGAAAWLLGLLRPQLVTPSSQPPTNPTSFLPQPSNEPVWSSAPGDSETQTAVDRQMLYDQIRHRLSPEEVLDAMFDVSINENDVFNPTQDMSQIIIHLMDVAERQNKLGDLALAVERILTELSPESLPRLEKLSVDSPPTVLRHFLLFHYPLEQLEKMVDELGLSGEVLVRAGKKNMVRQMLLHLYRRNRLEELLTVMQEPLTTNQPSPAATN
ncbi:MAG: hypothetical protein KA314_29695 [Chloroflexi bacterium]|nr:hypothetical protein [Chloroflexota bacterium]MBP8060032.1 hypothetical protein [Chloroflexota bacterium]